MEILPYIRMVLARWKIVLAAAVVLGILALVFSLVEGPSYKATAQVLVDVRTPDSIPVDTSQLQGAGQLSPDYLTTQVDILLSDRVALAAVDLLGLTTNPEALEQFHKAGGVGSPGKWFADQIRKTVLRVKPNLNSRVISIGAKGKTPQEAARIANAFAKVYRQTNLDLQVDPARQSSGWYDQRSKELRAQLDEAQAKLAAERQRLGVAAGTEVTDAETQRWNALSAQIAQAQSAQSVATGRTSGGALPDVLANPVIQRIQSDLASAEAQRRALSATEGTNNPDFIQVSRQVDELRRQLTEQQSIIARGVATAAAQSKQTVGKLAADLQAEKGRVMLSNDARNSLNGLQQEVDSLRLIYNQVMAMRAQASMLGSNIQTNVSILADAVPPPKPSSLSPALLTLVGMVLGAMMGVAIAIALEMLDPRMRAASDAETWLHIPNLGQIRTSRVKARAKSPRRLGSPLQSFLPRQSGVHQ